MLIPDISGLYHPPARVQLHPSPLTVSQFQEVARHLHAPAPASRVAPSTSPNTAASEAIGGSIGLGPSLTSFAGLAERPR